MEVKGRGAEAELEMSSGADADADFIADPFAGTTPVTFGIEGVDVDGLSVRGIGASGTRLVLLSLLSGVCVPDPDSPLRSRGSKWAERWALKEPLVLPADWDVSKDEDMSASASTSSAL